MAEFIGGKDDPTETKNSVSPPQVTKRPNVRQASVLHPTAYDSPRGRSIAPLVCPQYTVNSQQYLYQQPYQIPLTEYPIPVQHNNKREVDRPGTPALGSRKRVINLDDPDLNVYRDLDDALFDDDSRPYQCSDYDDRLFTGNIPRDSSRAYPSSVTPPTSPSQLFQLLLQRNARASDVSFNEFQPQNYVPNHLEWTTNNFSPRILQQNDYRREYRERDRSLYSRHYGPARPQYSQHNRRAFLNQNFSQLPYNMVRIKNSNDDDDKESNSMNGFSADGEGNHECHDLRHNSVPDLEGQPSSIDEFHRNRALHMETGELQETNRIPNFGAIYQGEWPMHRALWMSGPSSIGEKDPLDGFGGDDVESIMSFSTTTATMGSRRPHAHQLGTKVEMVYSLLSMLGSCNKEDMSRTLLEMSSNQDSCIAMRQSGCLPLLIQLLHGSEGDSTSEHISSENVKWAVREARRRASQALHNIVHAHPDDRRGRREARVLRLLEQIRDYSDFLRDVDSSNVDFSHNENLDLHPGPAIAALMKLSFDEEHRHAMCQLGGLQAIAELIQADHEIHGNTSDQFCVTIRRYAGMALTNLTFGDGTNKALLCSMKPFMQALVAQLQSPNEDLRQVTASVLRNLSWRADASSKQILREVGVVVTLMKSAMEAQKESTLKSILSALWNLSAHCSMNKADICEVEGALEFLVSTLTYKSTSSTLSIIENGGGILRNISSHIAVNEDYRSVLRKHKCLQTLLSHLKSPSLTIVSNACGTLWNLSARSAEDQQALWDMGAVGMLRNLIHSKHKMISMGSSAALKNLLAARPEGIGRGLGSNGYENGHMSNMPSLLVRKQKALAADIDENLAETCDNIESPKTSPIPNGDSKKFFYGLDQKPQFLHYLPGRMYHSINGQVGTPVRVPRSESKDSLGSTRSEPPHYKAQKERFKIMVNNYRTVPMEGKTVQERPGEWKEKTNLPFRGNSNIVLEMFRHLQNTNSSTGPDLKTNGQTELSDGEEQPAIRPNTLVPPRKGSITQNNRFAEKNGMHNGFHSNGYNSSSLNSNNLTSSFTRQQGTSNADMNSFLHVPGNKRTSNYQQELLSERQQNGHLPNGSGHSENTVCYNGQARPNVVMRHQKPREVMSSSFSTRSKDVVSEDTDQTPLIASRCSSLSSLTSCFQHSARSSWVSDVSQRTSAVISPSDLPDSPGYPSEDKHCIFQFTDKLPDAEAQGLIRPRPAWPMSSLPSSDSLPSSVQRMSLESDVFANSNKAACYEQIGDGSEKAAVMLESPPSISSPPLHPQNTPLSSPRDQCPSKETPENNPNEVTGNMATPNSLQKTDLSSSLLHTKISNLISSTTYSRSGIPIKSRLSQSFPFPCKSETASTNYKQLNGTPSISHIPTDRTRLDNNDNLLINSGNINSNSNKQHGDKNVLENGVEPGNGISQAFLSKCLSVCKKYPALSHKSSFDTGESRLNAKLKTSIPQIVRVENPNFDSQQHPKQLFIKSQSLPVYKGMSNNFQLTNDAGKSRTAQGNSSSTEENVSEDNILSSSPSACDESEGMDSDEKPGNKSTDPVLLRNNRVRSRKSKANRRSMEIRPPSEQSSEDDNKNIFGRCIDSSHISVPTSESEEKMKEDARTKEKVSRGIIPDLLEGAALHDSDHENRYRNGHISKANILMNMTDSMELRRGALMIAAELEEGMDDYTHSSTSLDLENMKPPSCMGEMSMTSSGLSDLLSNGNGYYISGKHAVERRRNIKRSKKISSSHRFMLKSVRQTLTRNLDVPNRSDKPVSSSTSLENLNLKSSDTSDLIENINPPSILEDLSMTNSCASLNSISSDILESRSQSLADPRSNSEMFQRLNAAAAMVQVYSRELNNMMTGSMKSSYNSDCLDLVKPPSVFQDIAEVTLEDGTEILSDPLVSDFELEEELPHDDEPSIPSAETVHSPFLKHLNGSTDNMNSSIDGDSLHDRGHFATRHIGNLAAAATDDEMSSGFFSNLTTDSVNKEDEVDDEDIAYSPQPTARRGPRIVKPINRETVRQMQEKKNAEKTIKSIRGKNSTGSPRNLLQQVTSARIMGVNKTATKISSPSVSGVRMTRTSALRASQNKQAMNNGRISPRTFLSKPPTVRVSNKIVSQAVPKTSTAANTNTNRSEMKRPPPLVKQNTFTKDDPKVPPDCSDFSKPSDDQNNNDKGGVKIASLDAKLTNRSLSSILPSSANISLQRKLSVPVQRRSGDKSGIPKSPSSQSVTDDRSFKNSAKKSPSSNSLSGRGAPATGSRASINSLSSVSSNSLTNKKQNTQKDVPSKISSIWKRSESSSSANSPGTDSSGDKQLPSNEKAKVNGVNSLTHRSTTQKGLPRNTTYEKLSRATNNLNMTVKQQNKGLSPGSGAIMKSKQITSSSLRNTKRFSSIPAKPKPSGGPRIVKPVTKPNAITSRTLRQSGTFCPYTERSYSMSSDPPVCISSGKSYGNSQGANRISIPLVTAPFAMDADEKQKVNGEQDTTEALNLNFSKNPSDSEGSDAECNQ